MKKIIELTDTPNHISRTWLRNPSRQDLFRQSGFDVFFVHPNKFYVERIDEAAEWSKEYGYHIPQLKNDHEAYEIAISKFDLPVNKETGLIVDWK